MFNAQRIILAVSCIICLGYFKHLWDNAHEIAPLAPRKADQDHVTSSNSNTAQALFTPSHQQAILSQTTDRCKSLRALGLDDVAIVLKTGSTEIYEKLPIHLATTFECVKDRLIYSDVQQTFAKIPIRDALALTSNREREELEQYHLLQEQVRLGGDAAYMKGDKSWKLDKFKFLPMISDAYRTFEGRKKWYLFIEADTYVSLHNLVLWLQKLDHTEPIYAGAQVLIGDTEFGHGGSGFLLSDTAAKAFMEEYTARQEHWDTIIVGDCCGDKVMAEVLLAADPPISLLRAFPLIQGETVTSLDWTETHWCKPAVTWHHVSTAEIDRHYQFELDWYVQHGAKTPILFRDYYAAFVAPMIEEGNSTLDAWVGTSRGSMNFDHCSASLSIQ